MPELALEYAVHLDGVVVIRKDIEPLPANGRHLAHLNAEGEAIYRTAVYAVALAQDLKRANPDDLVSIVLWPQD